MLLPGTGTFLYTISPRSFQLTVPFILSRRRRAFCFKVFGTLSMISFSKPDSVLFSLSSSSSSFTGGFINSHTNRLLTSLVGKYIITHQHLVVQNDFLPVVEVTTVKNESHFVVESSHNISNGIGQKWLGWNGLQQTGIDKRHFLCVFHSGILTTEARQ